jgi:hypothetical protein
MTQAGIFVVPGYMCKNIKTNVPNLRGEIGKLIGAIEGKIKEYKWDSTYSSLTDIGGKKVEQKDSQIRFTTTEGIYIVNIIWEIYNDFAFEERGIRRMDLRLDGSVVGQEIVIIVSTGSSLLVSSDNRERLHQSLPTL